MLKTMPVLMQRPLCRDLGKKLGKLLQTMSSAGIRKSSLEESPVSKILVVSDGLHAVPCDRDNRVKLISTHSMSWGKIYTFLTSSQADHAFPVNVRVWFCTQLYTKLIINFKKCLAEK